MSRQLLTLSVLAGAGVGFVDALPRPQWEWFGHPHPSPGKFPTFSFPGFPYPTHTPTGFSVSPASDSSFAAPTGFSSGSGIALPTGTGTGFSLPTSSVGGTGFSSIPVGTGFPSIPIGTGFSSVPLGIGSSVAPVGTGYSSSGFAFPTGTGFSYPTSSVGGTGFSSVPIGTGISSASISTSSSIARPSSLSLSYSALSAPIPESNAPSSLVAAASVSGAPVSSVPVSSASAEPISSAPETSASSNPVSSAPETSASSNPVSSAPGGASITAPSGCTFTDAAAAAASKASCSTIVLSGITVPAGVTLDMTDLNDGTTVSFEGTTTFEFEAWEGPLLSFSGNDITITGASGHVIDGNGAAWWDGEGSNGGVTKPTFFDAHSLTDSTITGLNIKNTPVQAMSIDGVTNLKIEDVTIDDSDGDTQGGHNTDCFDIGDSTGVYLSGITCKNQDDCMAINSGTDIQFTGGTCSGGHGLSIGSVGGRSDNTVEDIYIASSSISDSMNGVRIKCNSGTTGSVTNVTYSDITLSGITAYGIVIEQDYLNGGPTGTPTDGVPITDVTLDKITGTVTDDAQPYYILCAACSDWTVTGVDVTGGSESQACEGVPTGASSLC